MFYRDLNKDKRKLAIAADVPVLPRLIYFQGYYPDEDTFFPLNVKEMHVLAVKFIKR